jgi:putative copper export protein
MESKTLFEWRDVIVQYVGFVSSFWILGAVGFRYGVVRSGRGEEASSPVHRSLVKAAAFAAIGGGLGLVSLVASLLKRAETKHQTFSEAASAGGSSLAIEVVLLVVLTVAFVLAMRRVALAWTVAAIAALAYALRSIVQGKATAMVNPLHVLGGSLWIGTLFMLVACGLASMLSASVPSEQRETAVAAMVHRFSTLALVGAGLLGITGVVTAWTHLKHLEALWTTPYGVTLDAKLAVVLAVVLLGAWNWRRVGPALGHEGGALTIRRTATTELVFAGVVLLLTAVLVSVPSPKG